MKITYELTQEPCPSCVRSAWSNDGIRVSMIQPLPPGALAPLRRDGSGACCRDCAFADALVSMSGYMDFNMARIAVGNDRDEMLRLPNCPRGLALAFPGQMALNEPGDLDAHFAWLDHHRLLIDEMAD